MVILGPGPPFDDQDFEESDLGTPQAGFFSLIQRFLTQRIKLLVAALEAIVSELSEADRQERIELLIEFARSLPPLPERLERLKDAEHRVEECQSPVFLFVETEADRVEIHADVPIEAPTVRGFVAILVEGLNGATVEDVLGVKNDLIDRIGLAEILGMQRVRGLGGVLSRLKKEVVKASNPRPPGNSQVPGE